MAHNIAHIAGSWQAWYADSPAWHNLGTVTPGARTAVQVLRAVPVFRKEVLLVPVFAKIGGKYVEVPDRRATVRAGMTEVMGIVSTEYEKLTDADALRLLEAVITEAGTKAKAGFVSAGLLGNGARGFCSIDLSRVFPIKVKRDPSKHQNFLFGDWTHDGSGAMHAGAWNNRVDCNNMLDMATADAKAKGLYVSIRHAGDMAAAVADAQRTLGYAEIAVQNHVILMNALQDIPIKKPTLFLPGFTEYVIPDVEDPENHQRAMKSRDEARNLITALYTTSDTLTGVPMSAYRAYQAVAEYADHYRPIRVSRDLENAPDGVDLVAEAADRRFRSITQGPAAEMKARALEYIRQEFEVPELVAVR